MAFVLVMRDPSLNVGFKAWFHGRRTHSGGQS
jgi:hypothetical protein